eukprot:CAMPEP_0114494178 /NCGR_PEP_ID=MMETSP0109-20121206/4511_1 /TAXON_ID=29199 /ORGANISM="Chlorarachnion reptans, Strain CCCM449" /LENGTH=167 /DNA_ID=CAMNT_0001671193 /DNA_START=45 /DNA_END=548 /DNA_ORIENTATION=-
MATDTKSLSKLCPEAKALIAHHGMKPHPEGGYYVETYRSEASTAIYFLISPGNVSHIHRMSKSDEMWHFYDGKPMMVVELDKSEPNHYRVTTLGKDFAKGQKVQYCVKKGTWFGSMPCEGSDFSFVGCTVAPAFTFEQFELAKKSHIYEEFPKAKQFLEEHELVASS